MTRTQENRDVSIRRRAYRVAAGRSVVMCTVLAVLIMAASVSYILWAIFDPRGAKEFWALFAIVEFALAIWNFIAYWERGKRL